jgi:quercetin dioxygenase-like cupin family protein
LTQIKDASLAAPYTGAQKRRLLGTAYEEVTMQTFDLTTDREFHTDNPYAQPLHVSDSGRILRFMLRPGQSIRPHTTPHSPFYALVVSGQGVFAGDDGQEQRVGPNKLLVFAPGENHVVRALDTELVFVGILHGIPPELR